MVKKKIKNKITSEEFREYSYLLSFVIANICEFFSDDLIHDKNLINKIITIMLKNNGLFVATYLILIKLMQNFPKEHSNIPKVI
jgi:hypothetical protein